MAFSIVTFDTDDISIETSAIGILNFPKIRIVVFDIIVKSKSTVLLLSASFLGFANTPSM